ncbi:helix-turn-helix domain-containing protein [Ligilactobacillus aviarius]|uniref:helix-turn-helix domain-containing protein n=1 Tax=Ligilactobacillus aviarius TaxID=1606 RepID=UPI0024B96E88|nr:helix-turn-helix transcriptional regulator [Ligilactobacillus aviarius]
MLPNFSKIIRQARKNMNLTIEELAEKSDVSDGLISLIERNKIKDIKVSNLLKITKALNLNVSDLFRDSEIDNQTLEVLDKLRSISKNKREKVLKLVNDLIDII